MLYLIILIVVLLIGFMFSYQSELDSQDCFDGSCTHWVHDNKSRWRHNIELDERGTILERIGLFYSVVEWRRTFIMTIIISIIVCGIYIFLLGDPLCCSRTLTRFLLSFVYVFIVVFFIAMYYQDMWRRRLSSIRV